MNQIKRLDLSLFSFFSLKLGKKLAKSLENIDKI